MRLYTSYYSNTKLKRERVLPVRVSLHPPRNLEVPVTIPSLYPTNDLLLLGDSLVYSSLYIRRLEQLNPKEVLDTLLEYSKRYKTPNIALCCFEKPFQFCHRHIIAVWLNQYITFNRFYNQTELQLVKEYGLTKTEQSYFDSKQKKYWSSPVKKYLLNES